MTFWLWCSAWWACTNKQKSVLHCHSDPSGSGEANVCFLRGLEYSGNSWVYIIKCVSNITITILFLILLQLGLAYGHNRVTICFDNAIGNRVWGRCHNYWAVLQKINFKSDINITVFNDNIKFTRHILNKYSGLWFPYVKSVTLIMTLIIFVCS